MTQPHNTEAEAAVIAGAMLRNDAMHDLANMLTPEDFWSAGHRAIWAAALALHHAREGIDPVTLEARLRATGELGLVGGLEGLGRFCDRWTSAYHVGHHARIVADVARRRRVVLACRDVADRGCKAVEDEGAFVEEAERQIMTAGARVGDAPHLMPDKTVHESMRAMFARLSRKDPIVGIPSGVRLLDHMIGGFQRKKLYVIAGRPAHGKSALAGNAALYAATMGHAGTTWPSLTINLEMGPDEIIERHVWTTMRRVHHAPGITDRAKAGKVTRSDMDALIQAAAIVHKTGLAIIDGVGMSSQDIAAKARRWRNGRDCGRDRDALVIVDYLQLIKPVRGASAYNREQEVAAISRDMKIMSKELDLPVLLLCQVNREVEKRADHRPQLADLRESGAIEQDADVVIFVHRPCKYIPDTASAEYRACQDDAEIIVAKQRGGETGLIRCKYYGSYLAFENAPHDRDPQ